MFVKIIQYEAEKSGIPSILYEAIYQCTRVHFRNEPRKVKKEGQAADWVSDYLVTMEGRDGGDITRQLEKKLISIYVMNDAGQTIDKHWF